LRVDLARQLGETLKRLRDEARLSQVEMARRRGDREASQNATLETSSYCAARYVASQVIYPLVGYGCEGVGGGVDYREALLLAKGVDALGRERLKSL